MLRWAMRHRWVIVHRLRRGALLDRAARQGGAQGLRARRTTRPVRGQRARARGHEPAVHALVAERIAREIARDLPGVEHTLVTIGDGNDQHTPNKAAHLREARRSEGAHREPAASSMERMRNEIVAKQPKELRIDVSEVDAFNSGQSHRRPCSTCINGPDLDKLGSYIGKSIVEQLKKVPGAVDVDTNLVSASPSCGSTIDRDKAADLGVQVADIAQRCSSSSAASRSRRYAEKRRGLRRARARRADRSRTDARGLSLVTVPSTKLRRGAAARRGRAGARRPGPSQINRLSRQRQVTVTANVAPGFGESDIQSAAREDHRRPEPARRATTRAAAAAARKETEHGGQGFLIAFGLSFVFMYLVLAAQFESWLHPITILLCLPLTVPFALDLAAPLPPVAEHLHGAGPAGALRRGEEELHPAGRSHQQPARARA